MSILFQFIVIALVLLIAYWWANQGFFSAILHFVAVVCAGAIALAVWEPLVVGLFLNNTFFDHYAWGLTLVGVFGISLLVLRVAFDKLAPANVQIPRWADLTFGGALGAGSGVLTVGILIIGIGFVQSASEFMSFKGYSRDNKEITYVHEGESQKLWLPAHTWTARFFEFLSAGSLRPDFEGIPLRQVNPNLDEQALSLIRDTYEYGSSRITLPPDSVQILSTRQTDNAVFVDFSVDHKAFDHASMFVMSNSQIRLLGYENGDVTNGWVSVAFPVRWTQQVAAEAALGTTGGELSIKTIEFDDVSHYMTSVAGQQSATFQVEFPRGFGERQLHRDAVPKFVQIKGVRFPLPAVEDVEGQVAGRLADSGYRTEVPDNPTAPMDAANAFIQVRDDVRPMNVSVNFLTGKIEHIERYLYEGEGTFNRTGSRPNRDNRVLGIHAADGTLIVQVDVSRSGLADIYGPARETAGESAAPVLVDSNMNVYRPIGYIVDRPGKIDLKLTPTRPIESLTELPHLPTSGANKMRLIYQVTANMTVTSFRIGDETVLRTNLPVRDQ